MRLLRRRAAPLAINNGASADELIGALEIYGMISAFNKFLKSLELTRNRTA